MDMGIAQRYIIEGSRLKVIKATFNLDSWIKKFEKSTKNKNKKICEQIALCNTDLNVLPC